MFGGLIQRSLRSPALHFLAAGLVIFLLFQGPLAQRQPLVLDPQDVQRAIDDWKTLQPGPLTSDQRRRLEAQLTRSAILVEQALASGLDHSAVVELRLSKLARFLDLVDRDTPDLGAVAAARALGLHRSDPIVRRYLENAAEHLLAHELRSAPVTEEEIADFYRDHLGEFRTARRIRAKHVFIAEDTESGRQQARQWQRQLARASAVTGVGYGDPFYSGPIIDFSSRRQLEQQFGEDFAGSVWELPLRSWSPPIASAYGLHLVYVEQEIPAEVAPLSAVRNEIATRLERESQARSVDRRIAELRDRYRIIGLEELGS